MRWGELVALTKFCNMQGCKRLCNIGERYCLEHQAEMAEREAARQAQYDQTVRHGRDAQYTKFYHSGVWEDKRLYIINLYDGLDVYAYYTMHKVIAAVMVHHIVELKDNWALRLADSNLIPMSDASHRIMDRLYKKDKASAQTMLRGLMIR